MEISATTSRTICYGFLAGITLQKGALAEAERLALRSVELRAKLLGKDHPDYAGSLETLAIIRAQQGAAAGAEAESMARQALEMTRQTFTFGRLTTAQLDPGNRRQALRVIDVA